MSCKSVLTRSRAFGFETRVLRVNRNMFVRGDEGNWLSPFIAARCIRMVVSGIKAVGKAIGRGTGGRPHRGEEDGASERKSATDEALDEYRKTLENTFNDKQCIDEIMEYVREWTDHDDV